MAVAMREPAAGGRFGGFGGRFVPESLVPACQALEDAFRDAWSDPAFRRELDDYRRTYAGRPTALTPARNLSADLGITLLLKREDLAHTGSHKINNVLGQALLARRMGKTRLLAETGAGQHGVATATAAALFGMRATVFMGERDIERQALNVFRMRLLGAEVVPVTTGSRTLKDATNEALRHWVAAVDEAHFCLGSVAGPHPYPWLVREFQRVIGDEARAQCAAVLPSGAAPPAGAGILLGAELSGGAVLPYGAMLPAGAAAPVGGALSAGGAPSVGGALSAGGAPSAGAALSGAGVPDVVVACVGGGSNAAGTFAGFVDTGARLVGVEAAGGAAMTLGRPGIVHGTRSMVLQDRHGQIAEAQSIAAGLDYPGVGPEHARLGETGRATYVTATDDEVVRAVRRLAEREGIICAFESAHAVAWVLRAAGTPELPTGSTVLLTLSGRGDKDVAQLGVSDHGDAGAPFLAASAGVPFLAASAGVPFLAASAGVPFLAASAGVPELAASAGVSEPVASGGVPEPAGPSGPFRGDEDVARTSGEER